MASKKLAFLVGLVCLLSSAAMAQGSTEHYALDSSKVPTKELPQYSEFRNNNYPYPAKPRSMWELGIHGGHAMILGDIDPKFGLSGGISLRHALGHVFSIRAGYTGEMLKGEPNNFKANPANGYFQRKYRTWVHSGTLDLIASLNTISNYRGNPKTNIYVLGGVDLIAAKVHFLNPGYAVPFTGAQSTAAPQGQQTFGGEHYSVFYGITSDPSVHGVYPGSRSGLITTFGGDAVNDNRKSWSLLGAGSVGGGIAFKLSKRVNIGFEQRFTFTIYDYLDAFKAGKSNDYLSYTSARLNLNVGSSAKKVEPLWWINPNNFVYNELNRPQHMKIPPPVLPDADGDGVTDQFDMEPNTPAGCPVDVRGVSRDTDGDGVPDCKDKELITSQKCFPVDAEGVGTCPEPQCCTELRRAIDSLKGGVIPPGGTCGLGNLPSIQFKSKSAVLTKEARTLLASAAAQIKNAPNCRVKVIGNTGGGEPSKASQQLSWDRVNTVIRYMVEKQAISQDRFIFSYEGGGDANTVDLMPTTENGPNTVPAPHPNLKGRR